MRHDQRQRVLVLGAHVDEVARDAVDLGRELRQRIEPRLNPAEVVVLRPVAGELLDRRELHALRPICDEFLAWPPRGRDPPAEVVDLLVRDVDAEGAEMRGCVSSAHNFLLCYRSERNAARTSVEKSSGSSQAAKCPPLSGSLK